MVRYSLYHQGPIHEITVRLGHVAYPRIGAQRSYLVEVVGLSIYIYILCYSFLNVVDPTASPRSRTRSQVGRIGSHSFPANQQSD